MPSELAYLRGINLFLFDFRHVNNNFNFNLLVARASNKYDITYDIADINLLFAITVEPF